MKRTRKLASKGANAAASSTHGTGYAPGFVVDNKRSGSVWGSGGGWNDGTGAQFPDWVQITFDAPRTIDRAIVYLDRGFERLEDKLSACGATIERISG